MAEHSELPWKRAPDHRFVVVDKNDDHVCSCEMENDVDTIVLAANHHHKLVEALEEIRSILDQDDLSRPERITGAYDLAKDALAALKEVSNDRP